MNDLKLSKKEQKKFEKSFKNYKKRVNKAYNTCLYLTELNLIDENYLVELENLNKSDLLLEDYIQKMAYLLNRISYIQMEMGKILSEHLKLKILESLKSFYSDELLFDFQDWELTGNYKIIKERISKGNYREEDFNKHLPIYCPVCGDFNLSIYSDYLYNAFRDNYFAYVAAVLVTHYRHEHINYYDRSWKYPKYREKNKEYKSYEEFKVMVNNRAKRQILRKIKKDVNMKKDFKVLLVKAFKKLQFNDEKTNELIEKILKELTKEKK
ncbi:hypothetical protein [Caminibacter sp.]